MRAPPSAPPRYPVALCPPGLTHPSSALSRVGLRLLEQRRARVLAGKDWHDARGQRPLHAKLRIIPTDRALVLRRVVIRALVQKIDFIAERQISVCKSRRHPEHVMVGVAEHYTDPLPKARRAAPDIHGNIEHLAASHAHELALGLLNLKMQPAQCVPSRMAVIILHEAHGNAGGGKFLFLPGFENKSTRIAEHARLDQHNLRQPGRLEFHYSRSCSRPSR